MAALNNSESLVITVGQGLGSGFIAPDGFGSEIGSLSAPGTYRGKQITFIRSTASVDLQILINDAATLPQSFFTRITIEDGTGAIRSYTSASATFVSGGLSGEDWRWGSGSSQVFTASDSGEQHRITFYL